MTKLVRGEVGGPWGVFINTYALGGPQAVRFDVELAEHKSTLSIPGVVELAMAPIANPVTGAEVHPGTRLPEGLVFGEGYYATSTVFTVRNGLAYDHSGKNTEYAPFAYSG